MSTSKLGKFFEYLESLPDDLDEPHIFIITVEDDDLTVFEKKCKAREICTIASNNTVGFCLFAFLNILEEKQDANEFLNVLEDDLKTQDFQVYVKAIISAVDDSGSQIGYPLSTFASSSLAKGNLDSWDIYRIKKALGLPSTTSYLKSPMRAELEILHFMDTKLHEFVTEMRKRPAKGVINILDELQHPDRDKILAEKYLESLVFYFMYVDFSQDRWDVHFTSYVKYLKSRIRSFDEWTKFCKPLDKCFFPFPRPLE